MVIDGVAQLAFVVAFGWFFLVCGGLGIYYKLDSIETSLTPATWLKQGGPLAARHAAVCRGWELGLSVGS